MPARNLGDKSRSAYNKLADRYDRSADGKFTCAFKSRLLERIGLWDGCRILDVACGNGALLWAMRKRERIAGFGVDISEQMIKNASLRNPGMEFHVCGCEALHFPDASMDAITVSAAYHHFPDTQAFARQARRVLAPGGLLYIAEIYLPILLRAMLNPFVPLSPHGDVRLYSPEEIVENFTPLGFEEVSGEIFGHIQVIVLRRR